jgi:hypothetical protein
VGQLQQKVETEKVFTNLSGADSVGLLGLFSNFWSLDSLMLFKITEEK